MGACSCAAGGFVEIGVAMVAAGVAGFSLQRKRRTTSDLSEEAGTKAVEQQNVLPTDKKVQFLIAVLLALGCGAAIVIVAAVRRRRS